MTEEQKKARKLSAENGNIRWIKDHYLRTKDDEGDYVFISYKSDDFEKVLDDIVFRTCKKYGLRVYFDTAFDESSDLWIRQFKENMCSTKCKAFIAFIDDGYYSSYACLLEMMTSRTAAAGGDYKPENKDSLFFLPINLGDITDIVDDSNTGLGTKRFSDGKINKHAGEELKLFNEVFSEVADDYNIMRKSIYKRENETKLYEEATEQDSKSGQIYLNITQCRRLMEMVIPSCNDNDGRNKDFVEVIHDKLINANINSVFDKVTEYDKNNVALINKKTDSAVTDGFEYKLWGVSYKANKLSDMIHDVFDRIAEKYPLKVPDMAQNNSITAVALKSDVDEKKLPLNKLNYFKAKKEHIVGEMVYYVSTRYNREQGIGQLKKMISLCEENSDNFKIVQVPDKITHNSSEKKVREKPA